MLKESFSPFVKGNNSDKSEELVGVEKQQRSPLIEVTRLLKPDLGGFIFFVFYLIRQPEP